MNIIKIIRPFLIVFLCSSAIGQETNYNPFGDKCRPNCSVEFNTVFALRCPTTFNDIAGMGIGAGCMKKLDQLIGEFRKEDLGQANFLLGRYCSAQSGWRLKSGRTCIHGGPPPCCTAPPDDLPWEQVDPQIAFRQYLDSMKDIYNDRYNQLFALSRECYKASLNGNNPEANKVDTKPFTNIGIGGQNFPGESESIKIPCNNGNCPPGYVCSDGYCTHVKPVSPKNEINIPCSNGNCPPGYSCIDGYCKQKEITNNNQGITVPCNNGNCPPGYGCKLGTCVKGYMVPMGYIEGKVLCEENKPLDDADVSIVCDFKKYEATTDENGFYKIRVIAEGAAITYIVKTDIKQFQTNSPNENATIDLPNIVLPSCAYSGPTYGFFTKIEAEDVYIGEIFNTQGYDVKGLEKLRIAFLKKLYDAHKLSDAWRNYADHNNIIEWDYYANGHRFIYSPLIFQPFNLDFNCCKTSLEKCCALTTYEDCVERRDEFIERVKKLHPGINVEFIE